MSTNAIPVHVALVDDTDTIGMAELAKMAAAFNQQILQDFAPIWPTKATVGAYPSDAAIPKGQWAVHIQKTLDQPGALGYHTNDQNQPVAYVELSETTSVTVSHELLEMLADPWGSRIHSAILPAGMENDFAQFGLKSAKDPVNYLLEVADPCEETSYPIQGVDVSDFLTPNWYRSVAIQTESYSKVNGCTAPRQVANGGYVSFGTESGEWFQVFNEGGSLQASDLGRFSRQAFANLREWADHGARLHRGRP
jgi:hypothetical protein